MTFETHLDILKIYLMDCMLKAPGAKTAIGDRGTPSGSISCSQEMTLASWSI
jgi:hypothetical protein